MELDRHVDELRERLLVTAEAGGEDARVLAQRLVATLDSAVRLMLLDALSTAAAEITRELAPGAVEVRLRGGDPEFVLTARPGDPIASAEGRIGAAPGAGDGWADARGAGKGWAAGESLSAHGGGGEGGISRVNLRLPEHLKSRVEQAADRAGLSVNSWLVRAATAALERGETSMRPGQGAPRGGRRYTGWGR